MADAQGPQGPRRGGWLLGRATVGGAVIGAVTAAIGIGPSRIVEGFATGESTTHALAELRFVTAAPLMAIPGGALGLAVGILVGLALASVVPHVPAPWVRLTAIAITTAVITAVATAMGLATAHYRQDSVSGVASFIEWGVVPGVIALPLALIGARRLAGAYLAHDFSEVLPLVAATDPSAPNRVFSAVFGTSLGLGAILGAIAGMLGSGPVLAMYAAAETHNWPWRDVGASVVVGCVFAFYAAPVGAMVGLAVGFVCGIGLGRYAVRARRTLSPVDVARRFRPIIALTVIAIAAVSAPITAAQRGANQPFPQTLAAFTGIPLAFALVLAMIGAQWVRRAYLREEARPLRPIVWLTPEHMAER
jgi:hypothetical protein